MKKEKLIFGTLGLLGLLFTACDSNDDGTSPENPEAGVESKYIITATPTAAGSEGVADYILTTDAINEGSISTAGNGIEQDGTYRYYITTNNKFFSMLYGQGNPGAVTSYELNAEGSLEKLSDFQSETVQAFAAVDDEILLIKISRNADSPIASWYRFDTNTLQFVAEGQINTQELADKESGELAFFTWITQVGDKVYLPYFTMKGCCSDSFGTIYPNEANIAVYSYPEMEYETTIHDERTSFIGRYFVNGLSVDENGDAYAFSSSVATTNGELSSTLPSAVTRIPSGSTEFDDYYFNIEEASGGLYVTDQVYVGNGKFVGIMASERTSAYASGNQYAIIDVYNQTVTPVSGTPNPETVVLTSSKSNYVSDNKSTVSVGITTETGSWIYNIDVASATATQGKEVVGGTITAISKLDVVE